MSAWWRTEEEPPPQSRIGGTQRPSHLPVERPVEEAQRIRMPRRLPRLPRPSGVTLFAVIAALMFVGLPAVIVISVIDSVEGVDRPSSAGGYGGFDEDADGPSLVRADRFRVALAEVRERAGPEGSLVALRLDPNRVNAVVRKSDGERAVIGVARDLDVSELPAGRGGERGLSLNRIDPAVPGRLMRAGAERLGVKRDALSYLALTALPRLPSGGQWSVFFERAGSSSLVVADLDGRNIRVPGG